MHSLENYISQFFTAVKYNFLKGLFIITIHSLNKIVPKRI